MRLLVNASKRRARLRACVALLCATGLVVASLPVGVTATGPDRVDSDTDDAVEQPVAEQTAPEPLVPGEQTEVVVGWPPAPPAPLSGPPLVAPVGLPPAPLLTAPLLPPHLSPAWGPLAVPPAAWPVPAAVPPRPSAPGVASAPAAASVAPPAPAGGNGVAPPVATSPSVAASTAPAPSTSGAAQAPPGPSLGVPQVSQSLKNDVSPPFRALAAAAVDAGPARVVEVPRRRAAPDPITSAQRPAAPDPLRQTAADRRLIPSPIITFDGISQSSQSQSALIAATPPDPNGDIGPNHYVQTVNLTYAVFDRSGNQLLAPTRLTAIWTGFGGLCETAGRGDPIVLYDRQADRWFISQFAFNVDSGGNDIGPYHQCAAVSTTPDPTGSFFRYDFLISTTKLNDYAKFGVWPDAYYMSMNQFPTGAPSSSAGGAVAFERAKMLLGQAAQQVYFDLGNGTFGLLPSHWQGATPPPTGSPNYYVKHGTSNNLQIFPFHVDFTNTAASTFGPVRDLAIASFNPTFSCSGACVPQPGTGQLLDEIGGGFMMNRLQYRNFGDHEALVANFTVNVGNNQAGIRWFELRQTPTSQFSVFQAGTYAPDANSRWIGSAALDGASNLALGFSVGGPTTFPSIRYTGRLVTDPLGTLPQGEGTFQAGGGSQTNSGRWGDYSSMSVDPTDDCTFWYTNEYYASSGTTTNPGWRTRVGTFKFPNCGPPLPRPPVGVTVTPSGSGRLQVTVTANTNASTPTNALTSIAFGAASNGLIDIPGGQTGSTGNFTLTLPANTTQTSFFVRRAAAGPTTVPFTVTDAAGPWPTFVGGGPTAF